MPNVALVDGSGNSLGTRNLGIGLNGSSRLTVVDESDPANPVEMSHWDAPGTILYRMPAVDDSNPYVSVPVQTSQGVVWYVLSLQVGGKPQVIASLSGLGTDGAMTGGVLFTAGGTQLAAVGLAECGSSASATSNILMASKLKTGTATARGMTSLPVGVNPCSGISVPAINIVNNQSVFWISGGDSDTPVMPGIPAQIVGVPNIQNLMVNWQANFTYTTRQLTPQTLTDSFVFSQVGAQLPSAQNLYTRLVKSSPTALIRGGQLAFNATIKMSQGQNIMISGPVLTILGSNPVNAIVINRLLYTIPSVYSNSQVTLSSGCLSDWIKCIAMQESGGLLNQFATTNFPKYEYNGEPISATNGDGGFGIMQLTHQTSWDKLWDWRANIDGGKNKFNGALGVAASYSDRLTVSPDISTYLINTNKYRALKGKNALSYVTFPEFSSDYLLLDGVRGYNGFGVLTYDDEPVLRVQTGAKNGIPIYGLFLHQYRPKMIKDPQSGWIFDLGQDQQTSSGLTANIIWEVVPESLRNPNDPKKRGDPYYVSHVAAWEASHQCGQQAFGN
jgi:hypothetical protein